MKLRYGINPAQAAQATPVDPDRWPISIVNGHPSYINLLDALNGWQLVRAAGAALGRPAAASFKHVSPAGVALAGPIDAVSTEQYGIADGEVGALTSAYLRARDADPKSSYGDFVAVSAPVDAELARLLTKVVCDGVIAPGYAPGTVEVLRRKQNGRFLVIEADQDFLPPPTETREVFGLRFTQDTEEPALSRALLAETVCGQLTAQAEEDLLLGLATLRFTQSNSVCYLKDGVTIGIGAGQQSRVDCTRLAGAKADVWWLRRHPAVRALDFRPEVRRQDRINWQILFAAGDLTPAEGQRLTAALRTPAPDLTTTQRAEWLAGHGGVAFASDGALPFRDNIDHAGRHGVSYVVEPGGSIRSEEVELACREHGMSLVRTGIRLFHH
jgi:phosphoribosylaminoimidazolecarboxamide formyltransferase/IMP cyclohydrolase